MKSQSGLMRVTVLAALGALVALAVSALTGCSSMKPAPLFTTRAAVADEGLPAVAREDLLNELSMYQGVPYAEGGDSFDGIDCSGLVSAVFEPLGVKVPRTAVDQFDAGVPVPRDAVRTGDLVFFGGTRLPDHVGIAVSNEEMVHASTSRGVILEKIEAFSRAENFRGARRIVTLKSY
jgi:cell wall-associated NlpC family hydrolase